MQVLLRRSDEKQDIKCSICNQGFRLYWERSSPAEQATMRAIVQGELRHHHATDTTPEAHPSQPFNLPNWSGPAHYSSAALLGGLSGLQRVAVPPQKTSAGSR
jgi:hypothetical protein